MSGSQRGKMTKKEIVELMRLKGWSQADLAEQMDTAESAVSRWISGISPPAGPARILMREWLERARDEAKKQPA